VSKCTVVLSGGQDSTTCLFLAKRDYDEVQAVSFNYGQRHHAELHAAYEIAKMAGVPHRVLTLGALAELRGGALTDHEQAIDTVGGFGNLPTTFVPMRNIAFLALAAAAAVQWCKDDSLARPVDVMTGVCETDFSGYPDCRRTTMDAMQSVLSLAVDRPVRIITPLMYLTKAETVTLATRLDGCLDALALTVTCYHGQRPGCGDCPACVLRSKGFEAAGVTDPVFDD
jgi:7-cyano-7-deazaguanine synthase